MDITFCRNYQGDGNPPTNRYCRICSQANLACNALWWKVVVLSRSKSGQSVQLPNTKAVLLPNPNNPDIVHLQINRKWGLTKEDFLHFVITGHARSGGKSQRQDPTCSPSLTRQEPYVQAIVDLLGGMEIPEIRAVHEMAAPKPSVKPDKKTRDKSSKLRIPYPGHRPIIEESQGSSAAAESFSKLRRRRRFYPLAQCYNNKCLYLQEFDREHLEVIAQQFSVQINSLNKESLTRLLARIPCPKCGSKGLFVENTPHRDCEFCGKPIDIARLIALPETKRCLACQSSIEKETGPK